MSVSIAELKELGLHKINYTKGAHPEFGCPGFYCYAIMYDEYPEWAWQVYIRTNPLAPGGVFETLQTKEEIAKYMKDNPYYEKKRALELGTSIDTNAACHPFER